MESHRQEMVNEHKASVELRDYTYETARDIKCVNTQLSNLSETVNSLVTNMPTKITDLEEKLTKTFDTKLANQIADLSIKHTQLETFVSHVVTELKDVRGSLAEQVEQIDNKIYNLVGDLKGKQAQFETVITNINAEITGLNGKLTDHLEILDLKLTNQAADLNRNHTQLESLLTSVNTEITDVRGNLTKHVEIINNRIDNQVEDLKGADSQLKTELAATINDLKETNVLQSGIDRAITKIKGELKDNGLKTDNHAKELQTKTGHILEQLLPKGNHLLFHVCLLDGYFDLQELCTQVCFVCSHK